MPFKPNYNFQRIERDRAKKAAKEAKLTARKEQAAARKADEQGPDANEAGNAPPAGPASEPQE